MFKNVSYWMVILNDEDMVAEVMGLASKYNLTCDRKTSIDEDIQQDRLIIKGRWIDMIRFTNKVKKRTIMK